jgi:hypothetical protein
MRQVALVLAVLCCALPAHAAHSRTVQLVFRDTDRQLWVATDCGSGADLPNPVPPCVVIQATDAYLFRLHSQDRVLGRFQSTVPASGSTVLEIKFAVTGTDKTAAIVKAVQGIFKPGGGVAGNAGETIETVQPLAADLIPGGTLKTTFTKTHTLADGRPDPSASYTQEIELKVKDQYPRVAVSYGLVASTSRHPKVSLERTNKVVTVEKDGKQQQVLQQVIAFEDPDRGGSGLRPIDSLMTLLNTRVAGPVYVSLGFALAKDSFKEPLVGISYMRDVGPLALVLTGGIHFSAELEIPQSSGFAAGQLIDSTLGLTAGDIPTHQKYHRRYLVGVSVRY